MTIHCSSCGNNVWCIWDKEGREDWICKKCFMQEGGTYEEWEEAIQEARERREARIAAAASGVEPVEYSSPTRQKGRECYKCGLLIYWDDKLEGTNKFVEKETKLPHSFIRCQAIQHERKKNKEKEKEKEKEVTQ